MRSELRPQTIISTEAAIGDSIKQPGSQVIKMERLSSCGDQTLSVVPADARAGINQRHQLIWRCFNSCHVLMADSFLLLTPA